MSAFGDPEAEKALLESLGNLVQEEVVDPMNAHNWQHGAPPPPAPKSDNPAEGGAPKPEAVAAQGTTPASVPAPKGEAVADPLVDAGIDLESLKQANGKYLGKYNSRQELLKGVGNVVNMAKDAFSRSETLQRELDDLRAQRVAPATSPAPTPGVAPTAVTVAAATLAAAPVKSEKLATVLAKIAEEGGLLDAENMLALMDGISDQSNLQASQIVDAKLSARENAQQQQNDVWNEVDRYMEKTYPRSVDFVDEMGLHVKTNPVLAKAVHALSAQGDHIGATALAWESFERTLPPAMGTLSAEEQAAAERREIEGAAQEQVRKEAVDAARRNAGVSVTSAAGTHELPDTGASQDEIAAAAREMNATGLGEKWRALAFGKDLTGPWFD